MKFIKKLVAVSSLALLMGASLSPVVNAEQDLHIEVVAKGFQHQFWVSVQDGANKAAEENGATLNFVGPANETAIQEQVQMLNNAVNQGPSAILLASLDTQSQIDLIQQAQSAGIPIVGFDSGVPGAPEGSIVANASTDNYAAAEIGAEKIFEVKQEQIKNATVEAPVRIGVLSQEVNSQSISDRTQGFIDKMEELILTLDEIEAVAIVGHTKFENGVSEKDAAVIIDLQVPAQLTDAAGQTTGQTLLNKEDTIAVFASNEFASKALINANDSVGGILGDDIIGVGFDSGKMQQDAVRNDVFLGSITQDPISIGYQAVTLAIKAINGEEVEDVDTGAIWYNSENIDTEDIQARLYE